MMMPMPDWWQGKSEGEHVDHMIAAGLLGSMVLSAVLLLSGVQAPYGRYTSAMWGPRINGKVAWVLQVGAWGIGVRACVWVWRA